MKEFFKNDQDAAKRLVVAQEKVRLGYSLRNATTVALNDMVLPKDLARYRMLRDHIMAELCADAKRNAQASAAQSAQAQKNAARGPETAASRALRRDAMRHDLALSSRIPEDDR